MPVATAHCVALEGAVGHLIDVQVDVSQGVVVTSLVGRPDASINEARDRCRTAISNSQFEWPSTRRVTILLSPADLPKRGTHFDLAIAVGVLAAADKRSTLRDALEGTVLIGELTLDGRLRTVPGVLAMTMAASARGFHRVFVPEPQAAEAALVPGMSVFGFRSLAQVIAELQGRWFPMRRGWTATPPATCSAGRATVASTRSTWATSSAWTTLATRWRSPRPAGITSC